MKEFPDLNTDHKELMPAIEGSLNLILEQQSSNKFIPVVQGKTKHSLTFDNGISGIIPLITLALSSSSFPNLTERLTDAAQTAGDQIWTEGLLLHRNGLSTGITGCGYALHNLYRTFNSLADRTKDVAESENLRKQA